MSMELYHRLYTACLSGAAVCTAAALVLFFRLDIRTAWRVLAGGKRMGYCGAEKALPLEKGLEKGRETEEGTLLLKRDR